MKVRDYKTLLQSNPREAMLFDLTERYPRGPNAKLRNRDYEKHDRQYYGNSTAVFELLASSIPLTAEGSGATGGWDPRDIYELPEGSYGIRSLLEDITVPQEMGMGSLTNGYREEADENTTRRLFKYGAQMTRRVNRLARRINQAKKWVRNNLTTAIYSVNVGGYNIPELYVHGDSEAGALTQFEMFLKSGVAGVPDYRSERIHVQYTRPADDPTSLMTLNDKFVKGMTDGIASRKARMIEMTKEIEGMEAAKEMVYAYSVNMAATFGTDDDVEDGAPNVRDVMNALGSV